MCTAAPGYKFSRACRHECSFSREHHDVQAAHGARQQLDDNRRGQGCRCLAQGVPAGLGAGRLHVGRVARGWPA